MRVAVQLEFKADRKEPLADMVRRVARLFESSGLEPTIEAGFGDGPAILRSTSAVERALKKYPHLAPLERTDAPQLLPGGLPPAGLPAVRRLTNTGSTHTFALADVIALAAGVPRSLPFHAVHVHFGHASFGTIAFPARLSPRTGVGITDGWWVNGRMRSLTAFYAVDGAAGAKKLPDPAPPIAAILAGLGKPRNKAQFVESEMTAGPAEAGASPVSLPADAVAVSPILRKYQTDLPAILARIGLPHDLPPAGEARRATLGASGPLKPTLVEAFAPRGYDCRGGSGLFTLRRRTPTNHFVDIDLDVGTWSRSVTFMFSVRGPSFNATLMSPVTARDAPSRQYPIGDTANWERIVANIAAIVDELERTFVPEITGAVEPAPAWFEPGR